MPIDDVPQMVNMTETRSNKKPPFKRFQYFLLLVIFSVGFFFGGFYFGKRGFVYELKTNPPEITVENRSPANQDIDFALFWEVWDLLAQKHLDRPVNGKDMLYGAISGMVSAVDDPYTSFLPPQINEMFADSLGGTYQGIGAELGMKDDQLIIVAPLDGSPAKAAGVMAQDRILKIGGDLTFGVSITEAVSLIRGEAGTDITLTLQRGDEDPFDLVITRGVITISSVTWEDKGDGIAYIRISRFGPDTNQEWSKAVTEVNTRMRELDAIVLDVRGNPGGYLQSAVFIAGEFFKDKPVVYQESATGEQQELKSSRVGYFDKIPAVFVLINEGSASASEILATALRDQFGAVIVGTQSYGKGTIQDAQDFKDGSGLHITIAKWLTPKKEWVHEVGITPDVEVEVSPEDIEEEKDVQLEKALELAKEI